MFKDISDNELVKLKAHVEKLECGELQTGILTDKGLSYLIIGIPVWFNYNWNYLIFTTNGMIVVNKTLWSGLKEPIYLPYELIDELKFKRKMMFRGYRLTVNFTNENGQRQEAELMEKVSSEVKEFVESSKNLISTFRLTVSLTEVD